MSNSKLTMLKIFFGGLSVTMIYLVITTSLKSNMFAISPAVTGEPWFITTLIDFYFNIAILSAWVIYKERKFAAAVVWIISFILLGSIATCFYVLLQLLRLKPGDPFSKVLIREGQIL